MKNSKSQTSLKRNQLKALSDALSFNTQFNTASPPALVSENFRVPLPAASAQRASTQQQRNGIPGVVTALGKKGSLQILRRAPVPSAGARDASFMGDFEFRLTYSVYYNIFTTCGARVTIYRQLVAAQCGSIGDKDLFLLSLSLNLQAYMYTINIQLLHGNAGVMQIISFCCGPGTWSSSR
jgi:hypothetical protein